MARPRLWRIAGMVPAGLMLVAAAAIPATPASAQAPERLAVLRPGVGAVRIERPSPMQLQDLAHRHDTARLPAATGSTALPWRLTPPPVSVVTAPTGPPIVLSGTAPAGSYNGSGLTREVLGFATYYELAAGNLSDVQLSKVSTLAFFGLTLDPNGNFYTDAGHAAEQNAWNSAALVDLANRAHAAGDRVVLVVKSFDDPDINAITGNAAAGQKAIANTIAAVRARGWDGVNVDFEGSISSSYPNLQTQYTGWIASLDTQLKQAIPGATLTVDSYSGSASWDSGFMRIDTLAPHVDAFFIMAYDMGGESDQPNAPLAGSYTYYDTLAVDQYVSKTGDPSKVILGVPYYGWKFSVSSPTFSPALSSSQFANRVSVTYADAQADFQCAAGAPDNLAQHWDAASSTPWASWWSPASGDPCGGDHGSWRETYWDSAQSIGAKYDLVNSRNIRGTGMWALGYDHGYTDLWNVIGTKFLSGASGGGGTPHGPVQSIWYWARSEVRALRASPDPGLPAPGRRPPSAARAL